MQPSRRALLALPVLAAPTVPRAQTAPERPLRAILPFSPGGTTDVVARVVAEAAGSLLGQPVVIENRTGAGIVVGTDAAAKAEPDGQTVLITSSAHAIAPALVARLPYDPAGGFTGVAVLGNIPQVVAVDPRLPVQDLAGFLALLRANPGRYAYASAGVGSAIHLGSLLFLSAAGVEMLHVPYRGGGPAMQSVIGGETQMVIDPVASAAPHVRGGSVRGLAVGAANRSAILPDVPTAAEAGLPDFRADAWVAVLAPARTPPAAVARLNALFNAATAKAARRLGELGVQPVPEAASPEAVTRFVLADIERVGPLLRAAGVRPE
ncbi:tripartite tricarboxylate transporter substrate binding protein [Siccirubricoccus sp. G192]|uniref:Bug family tripartite tricarboxylate transporter substrate binding protein n=1 Tax=Siccirubricoccus sp. G192 TaxID=2849651 RepID=UPI001C2C72C2|nr:tripartite tricarboxylate transporter substrate-binding protein [Siccirubricoccus sp. G192]MBV1799223.1 tripartite tricarboxylate transporter substrate binding protein [Siccirubricoccus sp. G192]